MTDPGTEAPQKVTYNDNEYTITKEGLAEILEGPKKAKSKSATEVPSGGAFYNPIQQFNRDLSVLAIRVFAEDWDLARKQNPKRSKDPHHSNTNQTKLQVGGQNENDTREGSGHTVGEEGSSKVSSANAAKRKRDSSDEDPHQDAAKRNKPCNDGGDEEPQNLNGRQSAQLSTGPHESVDIPRAPAGQLKPSFRVLDALSATGLRALRYAREIEQVTSVTANDLSPRAVESIKLNLRHNGLLGKIHPIIGDATSHMYSVRSDSSPVLPDGTRGRYHVIDLDPYGTAAPFLDAAVRALQDGGLLCVTCTDAGVFASMGYVEKTFAQYGGLPMKGGHSHDGGLRLILHAIATSAARYGLAMEPLLSLSIDFYARLFVRLRQSPAEVKLLPGKTIEVFNCDAGCGAWSIQPLVRTQSVADRNGKPLFRFSAGQAPTSEPKCSHCGFKTHIAGPMWGGYLHNPFFIQRMLDLLPSLDRSTYGTIPRMEGMLITARDEMLLPPSLVEDEAASNGKETSTEKSEGLIPRLPPELQDRFPLFVMVSSLAKVLHCTAPSTAMFRSALLKLGYRVTRSHAKAGSLRTDAPWAVIWEVMREWVRQRSPYRKGGPKEGTPGHGVMRNDRSKGGLLHVRNELATIMRQANDVADAQSRLQALLWRLEHPDAVQETTAPEAAKERNGRDPSPTLPAGKVGELEIVFDEALGKEHEARKLVRYQINPRADWGPLRRAS